MNKIYAVVYIYWEDFEVKGLYQNYEDALKEYNKLKDKDQSKIYQDEFSENNIFCLNASQNSWYIYEVPLNQSFKTYQEERQERNKKYRLTKEFIKNKDILFDDFKKNFKNEGDLYYHLIHEWSDDFNYFCKDSTKPKDCTDCNYQEYDYDDEGY